MTGLLDPVVLGPETGAPVGRLPACVLGQMTWTLVVVAVTVAVEYETVKKVE